MPLLIISRTGSYFCDTCTTLKDSIWSLPDSHVNRLAEKADIDEHLTETRLEFKDYKQLQEDGMKSSKYVMRHFVFDFVEKVLLPRLLKQPGQLYFVPGIKVDIIGVACSNESKTDIYGLVEGRWIHEKISNAVISMLHHSLDEKSAGCTRKKLVMHAGN